MERKPGRALSSTERFSPACAERVLSFHRSFPEYRETPLRSLPHLAEALGTGAIYVKDESFRFGLNAFKVLGGSYAIGRCLAQKLGTGLEDLPYEVLTGRKVREALGPLTFVTATDGNHGRGVARTASRLGQDCVVYLPKGTARERLDSIRSLGARAYLTDLTYDDAVRKAREDGDRYGWIQIQDTSWEGYEEIPGWIMEGYTTMADEAAGQLQGQRPTHIFLQAGVGAMAGSLTAYFSSLYGEEDRPVITIVEPDKADCLYRTALADDGRLHCAEGDMTTIMAGLCCGEPCPLGWEILKDHADHFVSIPDYAAAQGMRILACPLPGDPGIISGESGAAGLGLVTELFRNPGLSDLKDRIGLNEASRILCFSTEGATDREGYRRIVWDGFLSRP